MGSIADWLFLRSERLRRIVIFSLKGTLMHKTWDLDAWDMDMEAFPCHPLPSDSGEHEVHVHTVLSAGSERGINSLNPSWRAFIKPMMKVSQAKGGRMTSLGLRKVPLFMTGKEPLRMLRPTVFAISETQRQLSRTACRRFFSSPWNAGG